MSHYRVFGACIAFAGLAASPLAAAATPADDIQAAVAAGGASSVPTATAAQFSSAFASVLAGKGCRQVAAYSAAAARLRPDQVQGIGAVAVAAVTPAGGKPSAGCATLIAAALIRADPADTVAIATDLIGEVPEARNGILREISIIAPGEATAVVGALARANGGFFVPAGLSLSNFGGADASIISATGLGSINPSNVNGSKVLGATALVVSPIKP